MSDIFDFCSQRKQAGHRCFLVWKHDVKATQNTTRFLTEIERLCALSDGHIFGADLTKLDDARFDVIANSQRFIPFNRARYALGTELDFVVFDARYGCDPDALGIVSGLVPKGGIFLVLLPQQQSIDHDFARFTPYGYQLKPECNLFYQHFELCLNALLNVNSETEKEPYYIKVLADLDKLASYVDAHLNQSIQPKAKKIDSKKHPQQKTIEPTIEQQNVLNKLLELVELKDKPEPAIITAERGRGKSALLGFLAFELIKKGLKVVITSPRVESVKQVFEVCGQKFSEHAQEQPSVIIKQSATQLETCFGRLTFEAIDKLIVTQSSEESAQSNHKNVAQSPYCLLIDEAASIPTSIAIRLIQKQPNCVLTTTTFGYEGSGQSFRLRVGAHIFKHYKEAKSYHLECPIRWHQNDPLEGFVNSVLLIDTVNQQLGEPAPGSLQQVKSRANEKILIETIFPQELINDAELLNQVFSLLQLAHYKTSPSDLRVLLNAPALNIYIAKCQEHVVAVAMVVLEGGLINDIAKKIYRGERRVQGHLIPQVLEQQMGFSDAAKLTYARIQRIAVHPLWQGQQIGTSLLRFIESSQQNIDALGTSFGIKENLVKFWWNNGYQFIKLGSRSSTKAGERSVLMLKSVNHENSSMIESWSLIGEELYRYSQEQCRYSQEQSKMNQALEALNICLRNNQSELINDEVFQQYLTTVLKDFSEGFRSLESAKVAILELCQWLHSEKTSKNTIDNEALHDLLAFAKAKGDLQAFIENQSLTGRKEALLRLRSACCCFAKNLAEE